MDTVQKRMAHHMRVSLDTSAHAWSMFEVDLSRAVALVDKHRLRHGEEGVKITLNHIILHAVVRALRDHPLVNCRLEGESGVKNGEVNLGVAVASPRGLVVPVVKGAELLSLLGLAKAASEVTRRAREGRLVPDDLSGSTFTVTNFGVFGQDAGIPIINQPNVAILGVGVAKKRPIVVETAAGDALAVGTTAWMTLGFDHRIVDGETAASFLSQLRRELQLSVVGD